MLSVLSKFANLDFKTYDKILTLEYIRMMYEPHIRSFFHAMSLKV